MAPFHQTADFERDHLQLLHSIARARINAPFPFFQLLCNCQWRARCVKLASQREPALHVDRLERILQSPARQQNSHISSSTRGSLYEQMALVDLTGMSIQCCMLPLEACSLSGASASSHHKPHTLPNICSHGAAIISALDMFFKIDLIPDLSPAILAKCKGNKTAPCTA